MCMYVYMYECMYMWSNSARLRTVRMACRRERDVGLASPMRDASAGMAAFNAPLFCVCVCVCMCMYVCVYVC
jgi:hypothetical protein